MNTLKTEKSEKNFRMSQIRSKNSKIEKKLRSKLWSMGYRYRIHYRKLPGCPDVALVRDKIAIFCDSEFWHGYDWKEKRRRADKIFKNNVIFWMNKIQTNVDRDKKINRLLSKMGWRVIRFWGHEIEKDVSKCVSMIIDLKKGIKNA